MEEEGGFGTKFRELRKRKSLTQAEAASLLDVDPATVNRWETGRTLPTRFLERCALRDLEEYGEPRLGDLLPPIAITFAPTVAIRASDPDGLEGTFEQFLDAMRRMAADVRRIGFTTTTSG